MPIETSSEAIEKLDAALVRFAGKVCISSDVEIQAAAMIGALVAERDDLLKKIGHETQKEPAASEETAGKVEGRQTCRSAAR